MTASSPAVCAMAGASPPRRSSASAASWRRATTARRRAAACCSTAAGAIACRPQAPPSPRSRTDDDPQRNFRFFDNRQKYLLFVNTCSEKWEIANRVSLELANIHPRPPAVRVFDAGVGDGTVLSRVMRSMHDRFPTMPFYIVGKEISLEDIRLTLQKMADRFVEHPSTRARPDQPCLRRSAVAVGEVASAPRPAWSGRKCALDGNTAHAFEEQITALEPFLGENWKAQVSPKSGNPVYERPVVLVLYRDDHRFLLDQVIPKPGGTVADYDLVIASQPYRARASLEFKAKRVLAPLARALGPGRPHDRASTPTATIRAWRSSRRSGRSDNPFTHNRHDLLKAVKHELGSAGARPQLQRLFRPALAVPLRDAHAAVGNVVVDRHLDAAGGVERGDLRRADRGRPACPTSTATGATSTRRATCCRSTAGCGSTTNPS